MQECVIETKSIKSEVYQKIAAVRDKNTLFSSNTAIISSSKLRELVPNPDRVLGTLWNNPANQPRFLLNCIKANSSDFPVEWAFELAHYWSNEPTFQKTAIRGFVTIARMYPVHSEAIYFIEKGSACVEDVDKSSS